MFTSPLPFWGGGGTRGQASTLGEVEEVVREPRAQKDLPQVTPQSGSVRMVQNRLCECIMDQDRAPDWFPVPLTGHDASRWVHVRDLRGSGKTSAASRMTFLGRSGVTCPRRHPQALCCPSAAADALSHCATCPVPRVP